MVLQLLVLCKPNCIVRLLQGTISPNVQKKNEVKRFEGAVSKIFIDTLKQMTIKHLQEIAVAVNFPGAEAFFFFWLIYQPSSLLSVLFKSI